MSRLAEDDTQPAVITVPTEVRGLVASRAGPEGNGLWEGFLAKVTVNQGLCRGFSGGKGGNSVQAVGTTRPEA